MSDGRRGTAKPNIHNGETISGGGSRIEQVSPKETIRIVDSRRGRGSKEQWKQWKQQSMEEIGGRGEEIKVKNG